MPHMSHHRAFLLLLVPSSAMGFPWQAITTFRALLNVACLVSFSCALYLKCSIPIETFTLSLLHATTWYSRHFHSPVFVSLLKYTLLENRVNHSYSTAGFKCPNCAEDIEFLDKNLANEVGKNVINLNSFLVSEFNSVEQAQRMHVSNCTCIRSSKEKTKQKKYLHL